MVVYEERTILSWPLMEFVTNVQSKLFENPVLNLRLIVVIDSILIDLKSLPLCRQWL